MKERVKKIVMLTAISMFSIFSIVGCGGKSNKPQIPKWYLATKVGYIVGTGSEKANKIGDLNLQKESAMLNARTELAKNIKAAVIAKDSKEVGVDSKGNVSKELEFRAESLTKAGIKNAKIVNSEFMDNGTLFIQLGVKTDIITGEVK
ncbi:MAG TPA: hypothetical protein ENK88_05495 [Campylobacterales bacterium]|nr:hypothetical protein [Campylobacterales bacterium]